MTWFLDFFKSFKALIAGLITWLVGATLWYASVEDLKARVFKSEIVIVEQKKEIDTLKLETVRELSQLNAKMDIVLERIK